MPNDAFTQQALANDATFRRRVRSAMSSIAWQVINEDPATANHFYRNAYANLVLRQLDTEVCVITPNLVFRPNVNNFATSYVYDYAQQIGQVVTASGDPDLLSQIATDWNAMAAAAGFAAPPA